MTQQDTQHTYFQTIESILKPPEPIRKVLELADFQTIESILKLCHTIHGTANSTGFPDY